MKKLLLIPFLVGSPLIAQGCEGHFVAGETRPLWPAQSTRSVTDVWIFGGASLLITDCDCSPSPPATSALVNFPQGGLQP